MALRAICWIRSHGRAILLFAAGAATALAAFGTGAAITIALGLYDAGAASQHGPVTAWLLHTIFERSAIRHAAADGAPPHFTRAEIEAGFRQYQQDCITCHGGPGVGRALWVSGMTPTPPYLVDMGRRWTPAQLHWIIANGVKMTGMPGWGVSRSDRQIWNLVAFLDALPQMSADDFARMAATAPPRAAGTP
jgi:mono/diheme cytochrome c family protein